MNDDRHHCGRVAAQFRFSRLFAEVSRPIFTTFLHDVAALGALLMHTYTNNIAFRFGMPEQRVKAVNFDVCQNPQN